MTAPFTHTPRPPLPHTTQKHLRCYGVDIHAAINVVGRRSDTAAVRVASGDKFAKLLAYGRYAATTVDLEPDELRELARCLIDAAADIEGEAA